MRVTLDDPVSYTFIAGDQEASVNTWLGRRISINSIGLINCVHCNRVTKKSFNQGYCYPCFQRLAQCDTCIIKPEKCHFAEGTCREPEWGETNCFVDHVVYLANTSGVKVGITRGTQVPTRWIDQGAAAAIVLAEVPNRYLAGVLEVALKAQFSDKTNWQSMLKNLPYDGPELSAQKWELEETLPADLTQYWTDDENIWEFNYPVAAYPTQVKSLSLDQQPRITGQLTGIRGQYLYLDNLWVLNIRKHTGYQIKWDN